MTLDVIDRPRGGALRALRGLRQVPRPDGCRGLVLCGTANFHPRPWPALSPHRIAVIAAWDDEDAADRAALVAGPADGAGEHWHVRGELARASFNDPWVGWRPDVGDHAAPADAEPLLVLISGELRARYIPAFWRDGAKAVGHAFTHPGYLGGFGASSSPLNTTSVSAWRTAADSRDYAFRPGGHADALRRDRARGHHRTERFLRIRPLATRGTLRGRNPFEGVLDSSAVAA